MLCLKLFVVFVFSPRIGDGSISGWTAVFILSYGSIILLAFVGPSLLRRWRLRDTAGWPKGEGVVGSAAWNYGKGKRRSVPIAEVEYSYVVEGERYSGYWRSAFRDPTRATDFVDEARGRRLELRYRKTKPSKSFVVRVI